MKKFLSSMMLFCLIFGLYACGNDQASKEEKPKTEAEQREEEFISSANYMVDQYCRENLGWKATSYRVATDKTKHEGNTYYVITKKDTPTSNYYFLLKATPVKEDSPNGQWIMSMISDYPSDGDFSLESYKKLDEITQESNK